MERNIRLALAFGCLAFLQSIHAGAMGEVGGASLGGGIIPFMSLEGFVDWIDYGGITLTHNTSTSTSKADNLVSGGGRLAAGFVYPYTANIDLTAETAWNYFGGTSVTVKGTNFGAKVSGIDLLVGAAYKLNNYELFIKGGTLFERTDYRFSMPTTFVLYAAPTNYYATVVAKGSLASILPVVKAGLNYDLNDQWGASLAYMHAFGDSPSVNANAQTTTTTAYEYVNANLRGPTLNSVLLGVRYRFV